MKKLPIILVMWTASVLTTITVAAEDLTVAVGKDNRPFIMPETHEGITLEILKRTLGPEGYEFTPSYVPYERRFMVYKDKKLDVVVDARPELVAVYGLAGFISNPAVVYDNVAVSLKEKRITITRPSDLKNYSVISWQGAQHLMGEEYASMVKNHHRYRELSDQRSHVMMLFSDRIDIAHMDITIFAYWRNQVGKTTDIDVWQDVDMYHFGEISFNYLFKDKKIRDLFNKKFKQLQDSGEYAKIYEKYTVLESKPGSVQDTQVNDNPPDGE